MNYTKPVHINTCSAVEYALRLSGKLWWDLAPQGNTQPIYLGDMELLIENIKPLKLDRWSKEYASVTQFLEVLFANAEANINLADFLLRKAIGLPTATNTSTLKQVMAWIRKYYNYCVYVKEFMNVQHTILQKNANSLKI